jgi:hypothetical protein
MAIVNGSLELGYKNLAWFTANPTLVLKEGQIVYLEQTGTYKIGNGTSTLSALSFLGVSSETQTLQNVTDLGNTTTNSIDVAGITTDYVQLDLTAVNTNAVGKITWNDTDGTANLGLKGGNVTLQIGQEFLARVVNKTATNISLLESNYQAVRITGAVGQRPKVDLALADNDLNSATTLGLVTETIANNQEGFITTSGQVREINTTGSLQGETWVDGDTLYLSGTVAGQITNIKPTAPIHTVIIGFVEYAHAVHGKIFVKVNNGYELEELHNVSAIAPNNNEVLTYETSTSLWKPKTVISALGFTPYDASNPSAYISGITSGMVTTALGFTPYNSTNPSGYITGITSGDVTTALGFTPYDSANPSGYITSSALTSYVPYTGATADVNLGTRTLRVGNGTASATAIQLGNTANLGLYSSSANKIDFVTQGLVRMSVNANGTVVMGSDTTNVVGNNYLDYSTNATSIKLTPTTLTFAIGSGSPATGVDYFKMFGLTTTGATNSFVLTKANNTNQTASTSIAGWNYNGGTRQWATGNIVTQSENVWGAVTYSFVGASTITNAYGNVFNAPVAGTNATITNNWAAQFNGNVVIGSTGQLIEIKQTTNAPTFTQTGSVNSVFTLKGGTRTLEFASYGADNNYITAVGGKLGLYTVGAQAIGFFTNAIERMTIAASGVIVLQDGVNFQLGTTNGTKFGNSQTQKIAFWNATPIVRPDTSVTASTFVSNTSMILNDSATFDGYTIGQVVKALRNMGLLA